MKETTVPQALLSSLHNALQKPFKTAQFFNAVQKSLSRTLSRVFWQQKYFLEILVLERSALAPENFSHLLRNPIRKLIPSREALLPVRASAAQVRRDVENGKRDG